MFQLTMAIELHFVLLSCQFFILIQTQMPKPGRIVRDLWNGSLIYLIIFHGG